MKVGLRARQAAGSPGTAPVLNITSPRAGILLQSCQTTIKTVVAFASVRRGERLANAFRLYAVMSVPPRLGDG